MALWAILALTAAGLFVFFLLIPALLVFFAVFGKKKAIPFEQYDLKKFSSHYYIPYLGRIADARQKLQAYAHTGVTMTTADGLRMYGEFYDQGSTRTAILFHGINAEMYTNMSAQALFLYESGFNVLMTCQRAHGKSEGRFTTIARLGALCGAKRRKGSFALRCFDGRGRRCLRVSAVGRHTRPRYGDRKRLLFHL